MPLSLAFFITGLNILPCSGDPGWLRASPGTSHPLCPFFSLRTLNCCLPIQALLCFLCSIRMSVVADKTFNRIENHPLNKDWSQIAKKILSVLLSKLQEDYVFEGHSTQRHTEHLAASCSGSLMTSSPAAPEAGLPLGVFRGNLLGFAPVLPPSMWVQPSKSGLPRWLRWVKNLPAMQKSLV